MESCEFFPAHPAHPALTIHPFSPSPRLSPKSDGGEMDSVIQDLRDAVRMLLKHRGFTAVAVITLALGIGANAAIFSVLDGVMLRPLPYPDIDRILIFIEQTRSGQTMSVSWPNFQGYRDQNQVFEHIGVYRGAVVNLTGADEPERLNGSLASSGVFKAMGISPLAGRAFTVDEDRAGAEPVAIISERLWRSHFNGDAAIVGRILTLNGPPHTGWRPSRRLCRSTRRSCSCRS
jgi:hypothetical protein